ncbi:MAG: NAD(+)/NADH kinase [Bdellovibrionales bacterium]|nr:NAD(+)/NADH kinase [Bdellovibrionales bacterium]
MKTNSLFNKKVKNVAVIYRSSSANAKKKAQEIQQFFLDRQITASIFPQKSIRTTPRTRYDLIIALGGDGTYLKAVRYGQEHKSPVLGVNMGSLGFLTTHPEKDIFSILKKTLTGKMFIKTNHFISAKLYRQNRSQSGSNLQDQAPLPFYKKEMKGPDKVFQAVNDIVIERGALSHLISISIYVNNQYIYSVKADGLIVASPLGSTAYNLAAGGPILHPAVCSFVITPVCSHSLTSRPLIIHDKSTIHLRIRDKKAFLTVDGLTREALRPNHILTIKKDKNCFLSLMEKKEMEFTLLREKLKFGQRD